MNYNENKPTTAQLSHESLDVYQLALKFHLGVMTLLPHRGSPTLRDQLERASISIILNIAEGAGRRTTPDRRRHFVIAQGSTYECAAILDILRLRRIAQPSRCLAAGITRCGLRKCSQSSASRTVGKESARFG